MNMRWAMRLAIAVPSALALGVIAWGGYWVTLRVREINPAREALNAFLDTVRDKRIDEAYRSAAPELRCRMSLAQFRGLADYYSKLQAGAGADISLARGWPSMHLADIDVSTHYDQDVPHHAAMLKLDDGWRVAWIDRMPAVEVRAADRKCGERSAEIEMIRRPLRDLLAGLERGDYTALAARMGGGKAEDAAALASRYGVLRIKAPALAAALETEPAFDAAPTGGDGLRALAASVRAQGVRFSVRVRYRQDGEWRLERLDVDAAAAAN